MSITDRLGRTVLEANVQSFSCGRRRYFLALLCGVLAALGQAPWGLWPLTVVALALLLALITRAEDWRRAAFLALAGGTGYYLLALSWIVEPFLVDAARYGWMAPFALVLMAAGLALFWALPVAVATLLSTGLPGLVIVLTLGEWLRGWLFTGFPWAQVGHIWIDTPVLYWAAIGGPILLCAITWCISAGFSGLLLRRWDIAALSLIGLIALWFVAPFVLSDPVSRTDAPMVRVIQPNAAQHEKWDPEKMSIFFNRQLRFTAKAPRPDLIVWPETAIPFYLDTADYALESMALAAGGSTVVFGVHREKGAVLYNTLAVLNPEGQISDVYAKHHLVPFGEYLPLGSLMSQFGLRGLAAKDGYGYGQGEGPRVLDIPRAGLAIPLICYEGVFPRDVRRVSTRAEYLLLITNDAWFGKRSGPYQHLAQARLRSVEMGLPMIRSANTGVSAVIDAKGQIIESLPLGTEGWIDADLPPPHEPTLYARTGNWPIVALLFVILIATALQSRKTRVRTERH